MLRGSAYCLVELLRQSDAEQGRLAGVRQRWTTSASNLGQSILDRSVDVRVVNDSTGAVLQRLVVWHIGT
jgi:hypothetical protein